MKKYEIKFSIEIILFNFSLNFENNFNYTMFFKVNKKTETLLPKNLFTRCCGGILEKAS